MPRSIIVIGKTGQLARALSNIGHEYDVDLQFYGREDCDLSDSELEIENFANSLPHCDGMIIAAAYTQVDRAEDDCETAFLVNSVAPSIFARICKSRSIPLLHISTDYVFSGQSKTPIKPDMPTAPLNVYGRSKLTGERRIMESGARALILRSSWVYDGTGENFLTKILKLSREKKSLSIVSDQIGRPSYAGHLARASLKAICQLIDDKDSIGGIYHVSGSGKPISWADFAQAIISATRMEREHDVLVTPTLTSDYVSPAKRPHYSVLDITSFERDFALHMPDWSEGLKTALKEWSLKNTLKDTP